MIRFYYNLSPNPMKVALLLEEAGLSYEPTPVDTRKGEQFLPNTLRSIRMVRSQRLLTTVLSSSIATRFCFIWPRDRQVPPCLIQSRRAAVVADVHRHRRGTE
jgi:hypothetical protein